MTREEAKEFLPIIQAFVEGKTIQVQENEGYWQDANVLHFNYDTYRYRIKPESKYRPLKDAEECWQEMQKHQPFGWIKDKEDGHYTLITCVDDKVCLNAHNDWDMSGTMNNFTFADGSVFGVEEEV